VLLVSGISLAQDGVIKKFDTAALDKIIKEDFKKDFVKKEDKQKGLCLYEVKDTDYLLFYNGPQKFVMFQVIAPAGNLTLEKVNTWNRDAIWSRAYIANGKLFFEVPMNFAGGITKEAVKSYYEHTETEWKKFKEELK
jgi:hypothetical protein